MSLFARRFQTIQFIVSVILRRRESVIRRSVSRFGRRGDRLAQHIPVVVVLSRRVVRETEFQKPRIGHRTSQLEFISLQTIRTYFDYLCSKSF